MFTTKKFRCSVKVQLSENMNGQSNVFYRRMCILLLHCELYWISLLPSLGATITPAFGIQYEIPAGHGTHRLPRQKHVRTYLYSLPCCPTPRQFQFRVLRKFPHHRFQLNSRPRFE